MCAVLDALRHYVTEFHPKGLQWGSKIRSMTFWSNAFAATAAGDGAPDQYVFSSKLGVPVVLK